MDEWWCDEVMIWQWCRWRSSHLHLVERAYVGRRHILDVEAQQERALALITVAVSLRDARRELVDLFREEHDGQSRQLEDLIVEHTAVGT